MPAEVRGRLDAQISAKLSSVHLRLLGATVSSHKKERASRKASLVEKNYTSLVMANDETVLQEKLRSEGFGRVYVWQDGPNVYYPEHTHATETAHIVLDGEMTLVIKGTARTYYAGDRCDVPAASEHSARMGPRGCRYLIGER